MILGAVLALGVAAVAGGTFFGGYAVGHYELRSFDRVQRVEHAILGDRLARWVWPDSVEEEEFSAELETIFVPLRRESAVVPVERRGSGGGLTSFGDAVLLLTHEGGIFRATSAADVERTDIRVPDQGYEAYRRLAASERYRDYTHNLGWLRYNDILHYRSAAGRGLAISYTELREDQECYATAVALLDVPPNAREAEELTADPDDWRVVYRTHPCLPLKKQWRAIEGHMAGARMAFRPPASLYLASGDYAWDGIYAPEAIAQDPEAHYGKVVEIDLISGAWRIFSTGHRNTQGIAFDANGELWVVEHGPRGGDELNHVSEGRNYGWPEAVLGTLYSRLPIPSARSYGRHEGFEGPVYAWLPSVAPSGLALIEGFHEAWDGDLLVSTLRTGTLFRLRVLGGGVQFAEPIPIGTRIRYVHQHGDGRLVLWTDEEALIFLSAASEGFGSTFLEQWLGERPYTEERRARVRDAIHTCMECHSLEPRAHAGPASLASIFGAPIGAVGPPGSSEALANRGGRWTDADLRAFLDDPEGFAPGTTMPDPGFSDPFVIDELIEFLEALATTAE